MLPDEDLRATISDRFKVCAAHFCTPLLCLTLKSRSKSGKRLAPSREEEGALRWATLEREVEKAAKRSNPNDAAALRRCLVRGLDSTGSGWLVSSLYFVSSVKSCLPTPSRGSISRCPST